MRYQNPSIESTVKNLTAKGVTQLLVIPLFPHYAMSSYESAVEQVKKNGRETRSADGADDSAAIF